MMTMTGTIKYRRFSENDAKMVREAHEQGATINAIRKRFGVATYKAVKRLIVRAGGVPNTRKKPDSLKEKLYPGVSVTSRSKNEKIGDASSTYAAMQSCPESCPFRGDGGCYAASDLTWHNWKRITRAGAGLSAVEIAHMEAKAIRATPARRDLRLHVAGDSVTVEGTEAIASACEDYVRRGQKNGKAVSVWGYTHGHRQVPRESWGIVSVLASCETLADVREAWERGYAASLVVEQFPDGGKPFTVGDGEDQIKVAPCPAQVGDTTCTDCRRCFDDRRLLAEKTVIGFEVHGSGHRKAAETLRRLALPVIQVGEVHPQ